MSVEIQLLGYFQMVRISNPLSLIRLTKEGTLFNTIDKSIFRFKQLLLETIIFYPKELTTILWKINS